MPVALDKDGPYGLLSDPSSDFTKFIKKPKSFPPPPALSDENLSDHEQTQPKFPSLPASVKNGPSLLQPTPRFPEHPRNSFLSEDFDDLPPPPMRQNSTEGLPIPLRASPNLLAGLKINPRKNVGPQSYEHEDPEIKARIMRLQDLDRRIIVHTQGLREIEDLVTQRSGDLNTIQAEYEYVQSIIEELHEKETNVNNEISILKKQQSQAQDKYIDTLRRCETLQLDFNNLDNAYREKRNKLEAQFDSFKAVIDEQKGELERELSLLQVKKNMKEKETDKTIRLLEQKCEDKRKTMEALEIQKKGLQDDVHEATINLTDVTEEIAERREVLNIAQKQIEPKLEHLARLREQAMREEKRVKELVAFFMETEKKLSFAETQVESVVQFQSEIVRMETQKKKLLQDCEDIKGKIELQRKRLDENRESTYLNHEHLPATSRLRRLSTASPSTLCNAVDDKHEERHERMMQKAYAKNYYDQEIEKVAMHIEADFDSLKLKELTQREAEIRERLKLRENLRKD